MPRYRNQLPQLNGKRCLTDGGLETVLVFHEQVELPCFAAFDLLNRPGGADIIRRYMAPYLDTARAHGVGFILESPTWRANPDWARQLGYDDAGMAAANRRSIELMAELRDIHDTPDSPMVISGCVGPRGDGYEVGTSMTPAEAERYHAVQIDVFADTEADMVNAITMTNIPEAIGVARAARTADIPVVLSFTVETDGRLPSGDGLGAAIEAVDAATDASPAYYMINCAHPSHFEHVLDSSAAWLGRIRGLRANASCLSHAELDEATELDDGDPHALAAQYRALEALLGPLSVIGGCCGTDHRHVAAMADACLGEHPGEHIEAREQYA